ncbi:hypothetical protein VSR34_35215 [Paraburkholderia sp. JHI2823]|uniref:hypothetical protein n=1 Tax=Paraburkholderia sp. JHI2823 TaxID=3112960 RepID=UPI00317F1EF1
MRKGFADPEDPQIQREAVRRLQPFSAVPILWLAGLLSHRRARILHDSGDAFPDPSIALAAIVRPVHQRIASWCCRRDGLWSESRLDESLPSAMKNYKLTVKSAEAFVCISCTRLMLRRLGRL